MAIKLVDELQAMGNFPIAHAEGINLVKEDGTEDNLQNLFNNGELGGGGDNSITLTQAEYEALPEEDKLNGLYYTYDTKRIYKNGVQYGASEPIPLTMEEYKALKAAGAIDEKQEYLVEADAEGILLGAEDIGYNNAESGIQATTVQGAIDKVAEKVGGLISDTSSSTTSTWSSKKTSEKIAKHALPLIYDTGIRGNTGIEIYKLSNVTYEALGGENAYNLNLILSTRAGEEIELFGGKNDAGWLLFARKHNDYSTKILDIHRDGYDVYVRLGSYFNYFRVFHKSGALRSDFAVSMVTSIPDTATEIPITAPGVMDNITSTESTWSSSKIASEISSKADKQTNIKNTDYLKSDRPYLKISRNGNLSHVSYYTCETYILCSHNGDMGALSFIRNDNGVSCVYKNIVGTLPLSVEKCDEYSCWLKYSSTESEIYTVYALNGYKPTVSAVTSTA